MACPRDKLMPPIKASRRRESGGLLPPERWPYPGRRLLRFAAPQPAARPRSALMPEPDRIPPTPGTNGAPDRAAPWSDAAAQGADPGKTGPELRADLGNPAADPATSPEQPRAPGLP